MLNTLINRLRRGRPFHVGRREAPPPSAPPTAFERARIEWFERYGCAIVERNRMFVGWVLTTLALLAASVVACGSVYWFLFRPDQLTNDSVQQQVVAAAREGTEAVLSYSSDNLDASLADAKSRLTGEFLDHYSKVTDDVVRPAVTQKGVKTEAHVARAAVSEMHPGTAQVLVFVNQVTTSKDRPSPALATSTVIVTMVKSGGQWRISEFKPV
jgi:Mce-associated membrane protein